MSETTEKYQTQKARESVPAEKTDALAGYPTPGKIQAEGLDKALLHLVRRINTSSDSNLSLYSAALRIAALNESDRNELIAVAKEVLETEEE